ncbi:hypothetical protein HYZ80_02935 [Candidatus Parcubacteria bacterium]|nr:hypothetical protein [Candidatus Parcubacteria bacterium]
MSKLRRDKAASKYRSVECRYCHGAAKVLDGSKLGYDDAQWKCRDCGCWNRFSAGSGEVTLDCATRATESPKPEAVGSMPVSYRGYRIGFLYSWE